MMPAKVVLVVEDHAQNLELAVYLLEEAGFEVRTAGTAAEARHEVARGVPDIILMDMQLPDGDGLALVAELRRSLGAAPPIVALTAHAMRGDRERYLANGCSGYISKPLAPKSFASEVKRFLA
jgi:two-component system cell cycle response regulator DivK